MTNPAGFGNVMSRLSGIKKANSRRVMPGAEFLEELEPPPTDMSGQSQKLPNFANFASPPTQNLPQEDMGSQLTPQSYDVRANSSIPQENSTEAPGENMFTKLGQGLANFIQPEQLEQILPRPETQGGTYEPAENILPSQQPYKKPIPPPSTPGLLGAIQDYFNPAAEKYNEEILENASYLAQGKNPDVAKKSAYYNQEKNFIENAVKEPWQHSVYGSAEEVANSPALRSEFQEITGIDFEPQIAAQVSQFENAMKGVEDSLNGINEQLDEQSESIKQRILNNQSTDADKYMIGLALIMPLLIGGFFGKEAGLGALAGGAKGFSDVLGRRGKETREDEASLLDIGKQKAGNLKELATGQLKKAELGPSLRKLLPDQPREHLQGLREKKWTDPNTGQEKSGVEIKPGLIAQPQYVASKDGRNDMLKAANEIEANKTYTSTISDLTDDIIKISEQLDSKGDSNAFWKGFVSMAQDKVPGALSQLTKDIEFNGKRHNAGTLLQQKIGFLVSKYAQAEKVGQLDRAALDYMNRIVQNPAASLTSPKDTINAMIEIRKLAQGGVIKQAENAGFYPEFVIADMEKKNNPLFAHLNEGEREKRLNKTEKEISSFSNAQQF